MLTKRQQEKLRKSCVGVFGLGGLGGCVAELLARAGVGHLKILDRDVFDSSNRNRQIFAFASTLGKPKMDVAERFLKDINPEIRIEKFSDHTEAEKIVKGCDAAALALDGLRECILLSRAARKLNVPLVEGWAIPYGNIRVYTKKTPSLEDVYKLPTKGRSLDGALEKESLSVLKGLTKIHGAEKYYEKGIVNKIVQGKEHGRAFAPLVWLTSVMMSLEIVKIILKMGRISYAPQYTLFDPFWDKVLRWK